MEIAGIVKEIDKLGRLCIPKEMRKLFNIESEVELLVTTEGILLKNPEFILVKKGRSYRLRPSSEDKFSYTATQYKQLKRAKFACFPLKVTQKFCSFYLFFNYFLVSSP